MKYEQNQIHKKKTIIFNKKVDQVVLTIFYHRVRYPVSNKNQFMNTCIISIIQKWLKSHIVQCKCDLLFQGTETYDTFASFDAANEGTFYTSVVAINRANDASDVVCSDGVTISTAIPSVKDVVVKDIKTVPRLLEDNISQVWLLDESLRKRPLNGTLCR